MKGLSFTAGFICGAIAWTVVARLIVLEVEARKRQEEGEG